MIVLLNNGTARLVSVSTLKMFFLFFLNRI